MAAFTQVADSAPCMLTRVVAALARETSELKQRSRVRTRAQLPCKTARQNTKDSSHILTARGQACPTWCARAGLPLGARSRNQQQRCCRARPHRLADLRGETALCWQRTRPGTGVEQPHDSAVLQACAWGRLATTRRLKPAALPVFKPQAEDS